MVRFELLHSNQYDTIDVSSLINGVHFAALPAHKAFNCNWIIEEMNERGAKTVISQLSQRKIPVNRFVNIQLATTDR